MDERLKRLLKFVDTTKPGVEIGPYHTPMLPKAAGHPVLVLDVFPTEELKTRSTALGIAPERVEEVDLIGSADSIGELVTERGLAGSLDYVISSHNFEHIPNPIRFLKGCEAALAEGGHVAMIVPDHRTCFDYFRPVTSTGDMIAANFSDWRRPSNAQLFAMNSLHCRYVVGEALHTGFSLDDDPSGILSMRTLREAYQHWAIVERDNLDVYVDTHCWVFTPSSLELVLSDLSFLGMTSLEVLEVSPSIDGEIFVDLRKSTHSKQESPEEVEAFYQKRARLLLAIKDEQAENSPLVKGLQAEIERLRALTGQQSVAA